MSFRFMVTQISYGSANVLIVETHTIAIEHLKTLLRTWVVTTVSVVLNACYACGACRGMRYEDSLWPGTKTGADIGRQYVLLHCSPPTWSFSTLFEQRIDPRSPVFVPEAFIALRSSGHHDVTGRQSLQPSDSEEWQSALILLPSPTSWTI